MTFDNKYSKYGLPWWLSSKESACNAGDPGLIPRSGRYPGGRHGNPLQYSCLENSMDKGDWWTTVHRVTNHWTRLKLLSTHTCTVCFIVPKLSHYKRWKRKAPCPTLCNPMDCSTPYLPGHHQLQEFIQTHAH